MMETISLGNQLSYPLMRSCRPRSSRTFLRQRKNLNIKAKTQRMVSISKTTTIPSLEMKILSLRHLQRRR
jgi:hypothetical protein